MKKIAIIAGIILTTGVTAFSLTLKENKTAGVKVSIENKATNATTGHTSVTLATAD